MVAAGLGGERRLKVLVDRQPSRRSKRFDTVEAKLGIITVEYVRSLTAYRPNREEWETTTTWSIG